MLPKGALLVFEVCFPDGPKQSSLGDFQPSDYPWDSTSEVILISPYSLFRFFFLICFEVFRQMIQENCDRNIILSQTRNTNSFSS